MSYIIGCDIGTTAVKVIAINIKGEIMDSVSKEYAMYHPQSDWHEQNPEDIWQAVLESLQLVFTHCESYGAPQGIVFSAAMHSLLVVDAENKPLTPLIIWADNRSFEQAEAIKKSSDPLRLYRQTGTPVHPMSPFCKLLWIKEHQPELINTHYKYVGIKELIIYRLTGQWVTDYSIASATGLFNIYDRQWNFDSLSMIGITEQQLPVPVSTLSTIPVINHYEFIPHNTCVIPGASDGCLSNLGSGALSQGKMALTIGTSAAVRVVIAEAFTSTDGSTFCYCLDDQTYISGGGSNSGGKIFEWALDILFPNENINEVTNQVAKLAPGSDHLLFLPYLLGERAPLWDASMRGGFMGLDIKHTRVHMMRAVQEGILLNLYMICNKIEQNHPVDIIYANGGFAENKAWVQMLADVFGKPVVINESKEAAAIGAAIMGFKALGLIGNYEEAEIFHTEKERFTPSSENHAIYQQVFKNFENLVLKVK